MKREKSKFLFFIFCCLAFSASAQDLTGIWRGYFVSNGRMSQLLGEDDRYKFEIQIEQDNKNFSGITYSYKTTVFYGKASCYGTFNKQTKKVFLEELKIVEVKMLSGGAPCIMTCFLQYSKMNKEEILEGAYTSMSTDDSLNCGRGTVFLRRVENSDFHKEPFLANRDKKKTRPASPTPQAVTQSPPRQATPLVRTPPASRRPAQTTDPEKQYSPSEPAPQVEERLKIGISDSLANIHLQPDPGVVLPPALANRKNELVKTIVTNAKEISINIYDNGTIDNDTVSVYLDSKLVISKQRLTTQPIALKFTLNDKKEYHELVMVADNLGEIPPNTSLMVVTAGSEKYEVRISSTEQQNAVVLFRYSP